MVYCGKPSGGCHACRQRKTRCDQRPGGCTQCERAKRECPGYRVLGDVIFRNESDNVIRKFKAKEARSKQASKATTSTTSTALVTTGRKSPSPAISTTSDILMDDFEYTSESNIVRQHSPVSQFVLAPTLEDGALAFFVTNYVIQRHGPSRGHLDYLTDICRESGSSTAGLFSSMKAVGLAGFAQQAPSLLKNAQYEYLKAIRETNDALKSPIHATDDSTLSAIMILSIYETITGANQRSLSAWAEHIKGAAALLKLRGPQQLKTVRGRKMFNQVTSGLMTNCIQRGLPLPDHIIDWIKELKELVPGPIEPGIIAQQKMVNFIMFYSAVERGKITDPKEILSRALQLDGAFVDIFSNKLPPEWQYETIYTTATSSVIWNGKYHLYFDYWVAQIWNAMRTMRIMLNAIIRRALLAGFQTIPPIFIGREHTEQLQSSTEIIYELQGDILATIPQHLGYVKGSVQPQNELASVSDPVLTSAYPWDDVQQAHHNSFENEPSVRMMGPYYLLWPLWLAGVTDIATEESRIFVVSIFKKIGDTMGIKQARMLAEIMESKKDITVW